MCRQSFPFFAGQQDSFKPPSSRIELGDPRIKPYLTSYAQNYAAPLAEGAVLRSPLRNESLTHATDLREQYRFAMQRVRLFGGLLLLNLDVGRLH